MTDLSFTELQALLKAKIDWYNSLPWAEVEEYLRAAEEAYAEHEQRNTPLCVIDAKLESGKVRFKLSRIDDKTLSLLRSYPSRNYDWNDKSNIMSVTDFLDFVNKVPCRDESILANIKDAPDFAVSLKDTELVVEPIKGDRYILRQIPGALPHKNTYRVPIVEGWRLVKLFEGKKVNWADNTESACLTQYEQRLKLDAIASSDTPSEHIKLGEYNLHSYQSVSVTFAELVGRRCLIAHEMGLGKTPIAIAVAERMPENTITLIVSPAALIPNWKRQLHKFTGQQAFQLLGEKPDPFSAVNLVARKYKYYIISYDLLASQLTTPAKTVTNPDGSTTYRPEEKTFAWAELIKIAKPDLVIYDEAHYLKNVDSLRSRVSRELEYKGVLCLTGTPITNRPGDTWSILAVTNPDIAGPYERFVGRYTVDGKIPRNVEELREILRPMMIRRTKKDVLKDLPPINRIVREVELSNAARKRYNAALQGILLEMQDGEEIASSKIPNLLAQLMRLKQITVADRVEYIADLATELYDQSGNGKHDKVIVFTQFVNNPPIIDEIARRLGNEAITLRGEDSPEKRLDIVRKFTEDDAIHFLVASTKAAGEGLDITIAGNVVFADLLWTPAGHRQAEGRAYGRLNDLHSINSYYVIAIDTIDQMIMEIQAFKQGLESTIIDGTEESRLQASIAMELLRKLRGKL